VIIKGGSRSGPDQLARHLQRLDTNENVQILETLWPSPDLAETFRDWQTLSEGTRGTKGLYHVNIDPAEEYTMTGEQWQRCVEVLEKELGLEGQPRVIVMHEKHGREHIHVVWARTDIDTMTLRSDSLNYLAHERASKALELEFGHEPVPGKHAKRDREKQPEFPRAEYDHAEWQQGERAGLRPSERKDQITALKQLSDSAQAFKAALEDQGYILAKGEKAPFVIVDQAGEVYNLARQIHGMNTPQVRAFMKSIDREALPTAEQAAEIQQQKQEERKQAAAEKTEAPAPEQQPPAGDKKASAEPKTPITELTQRSENAEAFRAALEEQGYILARGKRDSFVIVDRTGAVYSLSGQLPGMSADEFREFMKGIDRSTLPSAAQAMVLQVQAWEEKQRQEKAAAAASEPPAQEQSKERTFRLSPEEIQAIEKAVAERQAREAAEMRQRQRAEFERTRKTLDDEMAEGLGHINARQEAERARFERENKPPEGFDRIIDAFQRWWNPKLAAEKDEALQRRQQEMEERQKKERDEYARRTKQTRNLELENLAERHAQQLRDHRTRTGEDLDRYIREQEAARRLLEEMKERERQQEQERKERGPEWPPPPRAR
jgi:hypothetical protein